MQSNVIQVIYEDMKNYTDIEQSRKLAEILPLESADMVLLHEEPYETSDSKFDGLHQALCVPFSKYDKSWRQKYRNISYFPCWSLATLLSVLNFPSLTQNKEDEWEVCVLDHKSDGYINVLADNPVDACYEMILKLHELNLL